jgi:hypothetical protein
MISQIQKDEITRLLGSKYLQIIKEHLTKKEIYSRGDREFSDRTISRILNGDAENHEIEKAIIDLWEDRLNEIHAEEERKQRLLSASLELQNI